MRHVFPPIFFFPPWSTSSSSLSSSPNATSFFSRHSAGFGLLFYFPSLQETTKKSSSPLFLSPFFYLFFFFFIHGPSFIPLTWPYWSPLPTWDTDREGTRRPEKPVAFSIQPGKHHPPFFNFLLIKTRTTRHHYFLPIN